MPSLRAVFVVTVETKPDGDYYFDQADLVRNVVPWIEGALDDRDDIRTVTIVEQPAPADRAAILREGANALACLGPEDSLVSGRTAWNEAIEILRRMADEAPQPDTQAQSPRHRWCVETLDPVAGEWAPGTRFLNRGHAVERYQVVSGSHPTWNDGGPVERRLVRETVTYTVEPAAVPRPGSDGAQPSVPADLCQFHTPAGDPCAADGCGHAAGADCHPKES